MKTINRASLVTVQPRATSPKGDQVRERSIDVVPHDEDEDAIIFAVLIGTVNCLMALGTVSSAFTVLTRDLGRVSTATL